MKESTLNRPTDLCRDVFIELHNIDYIEQIEVGEPILHKKADGTEGCYLHMQVRLKSREDLENQGLLTEESLAEHGIK